MPHGCDGQKKTPENYLTIIKFSIVKDEMNDWYERHSPLKYKRDI